MFASRHHSVVGGARPCLGIVLCCLCWWPWRTPVRMLIVNATSSTYCVASAATSPFDLPLANLCGHGFVEACANYRELSAWRYKTSGRTTAAIATAGRDGNNNVKSTDAREIVNGRTNPWKEKRFTNGKHEKRFGGGMNN